MKKLFLIPLFALLGLSSCIKEDILADFVPPVLRVINPVDTISLESTYLLEVSYFNSVGKLDEDVPVWWSTSDTSIATISDNGLITPKQSGVFSVKIEVQDDNGVWIENEDIVVGTTTVEIPKIKTGTLNTTSSYILDGNFVAEEIDGDLVITIDDTYKTTSVLPQLVLFLSNNVNTVNGALEVAPVTVFSGAHTYTVPGVGINDYSHLLYFCKPFNVKVGDGALLDE